MHLPEMLRARCITKALRMHVPEIAAGIYDPYEIDANVTVQKLMSTEAPPPNDENLSNLRSLLAGLSSDTRGRAVDLIMQKCKVSEIDSLNEKQAGKLVNNWDSFMEMPEMSGAGVEEDGSPQV